MRISTSMLYDSGVSGMQRQTQQLLQTQQQLASGRKLLTPSDDPVAAARALQVSQAQALNQQYQSNAGSATDGLGQEQNALSSLTQLLQNVKTDAVSAGNGALSPADRANLAQDLQQQYQQLLALANSTDGAGQYLFSGYQGGTQPFTAAAPGSVTYNGDQGQRTIQVAPAEQVAVSDSGATVFLNIPTGNGSFVGQAAAGNTGSGVIGSGSVPDPIKWNAPGNSKDLTIKFAVDSSTSPPTTTYDVVDNSTGQSLLTGSPAAASGPYPGQYTSGSAIQLGATGAEVQIQGQPANGDSFTIKPSQSQDLFTTLSNLAALLQGPSTGAALSNGLEAAQQNVDNALNTVLGVQASVGARLKQVAAAQSAATSAGLQYSQTLSNLQDLNYAAAASSYQQDLTNLQAAQKSFAQVMGLSLFSYLP